MRWPIEEASKDDIMSPPPPHVNGCRPLPQLGRAKLAAQSVAVGNMHRLEFLELRQQGTRSAAVVAITLQRADDVALPCNVPLAFGDVTFR